MRRKMPALVAVAAAAAMLVLPGQAFAGRLVATGHDADSHCSGLRRRRPVPLRPGGGRATCAAARRCRRARCWCSTAPAAATSRRHSRMRPCRAAPTRSSARARTSRVQRAAPHDSDLQRDGRGLVDRRAQPDGHRRHQRAARPTSRPSSTRAAGSWRSPATPTETTRPTPTTSSRPIGIGGKAVTSPFRLTPQGQALGFQDSVNGIGTNDDINCCPTHNSFQEPAAGERAAGRGARLERPAGTRRPCSRTAPSAAARS